MTLRTCGVLLLAALVQIPAPQTVAPAVTASLVVRLSAGKATYQIGEEIPLELEFRGKAEADFYFSTATYDRSGRMWQERYAVTPADGVVDPLADFYSSVVTVGGGISSFHPLDDTPFLLHVSLNDWWRITQPGTYRVAVTSSRLQRHSGQPAPTVSSEPVTFTVVPADAASDAARIERATALIDTGTREDVRHGTALLRYVGSPDAAPILIQRYDAVAKANAWDIEAALLSSPEREFLVKQMEARLDRDPTVDSVFVDTLARLRTLLDVPRTETNRQERVERLKTAQADYDARWRATLERQPVTAKTVGIRLSRLQRDSSPDFRAATSRILDGHPAEAAEAFSTLDSNLQRWLLDSSATWPLLNRPWILPALRDTFARGNATGSPFEPSDAALRRIYEVAPDEGRRLMLEEIRTSSHHTSYEVLATLPDVELPELDSTLSARYTAIRPNSANNDRGTTAWLIARYGSAQLLPFVKEAVARRRLPCTPEGAFIAYLLKHEPDTATTRLDPSFDRRVGCTNALSDVAQHYWDGRLEAAAIRQLNASNASIVSEAARVLGSHGTIAVKPALIDRLKSWSVEWTGRIEELSRWNPSVESPRGIENSIVNALASNARFALTKDEIATIRSLCVTDSCRSIVDQRLK